MSMTFDLYDLDIVKPGVAMEIKISYSIPPFHHSSQSLFWLPIIGINWFRDPGHDAACCLPLHTI